MAFLRIESYQYFLQVGQSLHILSMPFVCQLHFDLFFSSFRLPLRLLGDGLFSRSLLFHYRKSVTGKIPEHDG